MKLIVRRYPFYEEKLVIVSRCDVGSLTNLYYCNSLFSGDLYFFIGLF
jgi:hypothetical protein